MYLGISWKQLQCSPFLRKLYLFLIFYSSVCVCVCVCVCVFTHFYPQSFLLFIRDRYSLSKVSSVLVFSPHWKFLMISLHNLPNFISSLSTARPLFSLWFRRIGWDLPSNSFVLFFSQEQFIFFPAHWSAVVTYNCLASLSSPGEDNNVPSCCC